MPKERPYKETEHQSAFTAKFDIHLTRRRSRSFDKCFRELERLITSALKGSAIDEQIGPT